MTRQVNPDTLDSQGNPIDIDWSLGVVVKSDNIEDCYTRRKRKLFTKPKK